MSLATPAGPTRYVVGPGPGIVASLSRQGLGSSAFPSLLFRDNIGERFKSPCRHRCIEPVRTVAPHQTADKYSYTANPGRGHGRLVSSCRLARLMRVGLLPPALKRRVPVEHAAWFKKKLSSAIRPCYRTLPHCAAICCTDSMVDAGAFRCWSSAATALVGNPPPRPQPDPPKPIPDGPADI